MNTENPHLPPITRKREKVQTAEAPESVAKEITLPTFERRAYQREVMSRVDGTGLMALLWRRQAGKTSTLAEIAVKKMIRRPGRVVIFASASLLLGREIIQKESQVLMGALTLARVKASGIKVEAVDGKSGHKLKMPVEGVSRLVADDFAELFEAQRLEFRVRHAPGLFSRTKVIAPNPATARGWTGDVMIDEVGFIADLRGLWEAMEPIVASDRDFRVVMCTTPPGDDGHFVFELLAPCGTADWAPSASGNWYRSEAGILVHRCDIYDTAEAGAPLYDLETRQPLTPEEHYGRAIDKDAWRRNYGLEFLPGGISAVTFLALGRAQTMGQGECRCVVLDGRGRKEPLSPSVSPPAAPAPQRGESEGAGEMQLQEALDFLQAHLRDGAVGLGLDLATTERETSNPSALAVMERVGEKFMARLVLVWKTCSPAISEEIIAAVLNRLDGRGPGRQAERLCIDATNERYFAAQLRQRFDRGLYVELVVGSEKAQAQGQNEAITTKALLGHEFLNAMEAGLVALPPERYLRDDFRLVKRCRGSFANEVSAQGMHGDTFDACKLAYRAVTEGKPGPIAFVV